MNWHGWYKAGCIGWTARPRSVIKGCRILTVFLRASLQPILCQAQVRVHQENRPLWLLMHYFRKYKGLFNISEPPHLSNHATKHLGLGVNRQLAVISPLSCDIELHVAVCIPALNPWLTMQTTTPDAPSDFTGSQTMSLLHMIVFNQVLPLIWMFKF